MYVPVRDASLTKTESSALCVRSSRRMFGETFSRFPTRSHVSIIIKRRTTIFWNRRRNRGFRARLWSSHPNSLNSCSRILRLYQSQRSPRWIAVRHPTQRRAFQRPNECNLLNCTTKLANGLTTTPAIIHSIGVFASCDDRHQHQRMHPPHSIRSK
jgi:hypothetical protein